MTYIQKTIFGSLLLLLTACTALMPAPLQVGETEAQVIAKRGQPTARMTSTDGYVLEYSRNPWGQAIDMARFDRDGRLLSFEQVLTTEKFATLKPGVSTKNDVLLTIGHPSETTYFSRLQLEVWTYPYKESGVWNSVMNVGFDNNGILKKLENGPDLRFDRDGKFGFGRM